jgi:hypothetical protein
MQAAMAAAALFFMAIGGFAKRPFWHGGVGA